MLTSTNSIPLKDSALHDKCVFQALHTSQLNVEQLDRLKAAIQGSLQLLSDLFSISNGDKPLSWDITEVRIHGSTMLHALFEEDYSDLDYIARVHPTANKIKEILRLLANRCAEREINHKITHITDQEHEWGILQITNVGQRSIDIQFCYVYEQPFCVLDGGGIDIAPWLCNTAGNPTWVSNFYTYEEFINCWNRRLVTAFPPARREVSEKDFALYIFKTKRGVFRLGTHTSVKGRVTDRAKYKLQLWHKYLGENIRKKLPKAFFRSVELNLSNHCHTDEAKRNYLFFFCYGLPDDVPLEELSSLWPKTGIDALDAPWDSKINHKERRLLFDVMALLCYFPEAFSSSPYRSRPHLEQQGDEQVYLLEIGQALRPLKLRLPVDPLPILTSVCISFSGEKRQINPFIHTLTGIKDAHKIATLTLSTLKPVLQNRLANTTRFLSPLTHSENSHQANNEALKTLHHCFHDFFQTLVFLPEEKEKSTRWFDQFFISSRELHQLSSDQCDSYLINTLKIIYDSTKHPDQIDPLIDRLLSLPPPLYDLLRPLESLRRKKTSVKNFRPYHIQRSLTALQLANLLSVKVRNSWMKKKLLALSTSLEKGMGDEEVRAAVQRVPELHHLLVDKKMPEKQSALPPLKVTVISPPQPTKPSQRESSSKKGQRQKKIAEGESTPIQQATSEKNSPEKVFNFWNSSKEEIASLWRRLASSTNLYDQADEILQELLSTDFSPAERRALLEKMAYPVPRDLNPACLTVWRDLEIHLRKNRSDNDLFSEQHSRLLLSLYPKPTPEQWNEWIEIWKARPTRPPKGEWLVRFFSCFFENPQIYSHCFHSLFTDSELFSPVTITSAFLEWSEQASSPPKNLDLNVLKQLLKYIIPQTISKRWIKAFNGLIHHIDFQNLSNNPELLLLLLQGSLSVCEQTKGELRNEALLRIENVLKTLLSLPELDQNHSPFIPLIDRLTRLNLREFKTPFSIYQGALQLGVKIRAPLPQMREWLLRGTKPSPQFPSSLFEPLTAKNVEWLDRLMHSLTLSEREACSPELYKIYYDYIVAEYERKQLSLNDYVLLFSSSATRKFITPALMEHLWERIGAFDDEKENRIKRELPLFILLSENTGEEWRQVRQLICLSPRLSDHWETCSQMNEDLLYSLIFFDQEARSGTSDQAKAPREFPPSTLIQNADLEGTESTNQIPPILLSHLLKKFSDNLNENLWENALKIYSEDILPILQKNPSLKRAANLIVNFLFASPVPPNGKNRYLDKFLESLLTLDTSDEVYATIVKNFIYQYESQYLSQVTNKENLLVDSGTFYQIAIQMAERGSTVVGKILFLWLTFTPIPWNLIENVYLIMGRTCVEETKKAALPNATAYSSIWLPLHLETLFSRIKSENDVSMRLFYDLLSVILPNTPVLEDSMFACIFDKVEIKQEQIPYLYRIGKLFYPSLVKRMSLIRRLRVAMGLTDPGKDPLLLLGLASLCSEYPGISFSIEETNRILRAVKENPLLKTDKNWCKLLEVNRSRKHQFLSLTREEYKKLVLECAEALIKAPSPIQSESAHSLYRSMIALYLEINPKNCDERRLWVDKTYTIASMIDEMSLEDLKSLSHLLFAKFGIANQKERNTLTVKWFWILSEKVFDSALANAAEAHESNVAIVNRIVEATKTPTFKSNETDELLMGINLCLLRFLLEDSENIAENCITALNKLIEHDVFKSTPKAIESFSKKVIAMSKYRKSTPIQDKYFWVLLDQAFNNDQSSTLIEALKKTAEQACRSHESEIAIRSLSLTAKFLPKDAFITLNQRWALYWESRPEGSSNKAKFVDAWELLVKMTKEHLNVELNPSTPQRVENTPNESPTEAVIDPISHQFYRFVQLAENPHSFQSPCSINRTVDELLKILSYLSRQAPDLPAKPWCMATCLNGFLNKLIENQTYQLLSPEAWRNLGDAWSEVHRELILTNRQFDPHSELPAKSLQNILIKKLLGEILANPSHHGYVRFGNPSEKMHLHAKLFTALSETKSPTEILVLFKELYRENEKIDVYSLQLFATITNRLVVEESEIALYQQALNDLYSKLLPHLHRILNDSSNPKGQISCTEVFYRMMSETTPKSSNCMKSKEWLETFEQARKIHIDYAVDKKELWDCFIRLMGSLNINHCFKMENSFNTTFLKRMNAHFHQRSRERSFEDQITNTLTLCLIGCYFLVYIPPEDYETYLEETGELYKKGMFDTKDRLYLIGAWNAATESFEGVLNTLSKGTKGAAVVKTKTFISCKDLLKNAKELINKKMLR